MLSRASLRFLVLGSAAVCASAQAVVSTHSGVVHYFEGTVLLGGQPLESRLGKFSMMPEGSLLRTEQGRAEVLLTPGTILRLDQNSSLRMLSNSLEDTRVELVAGSATLDAGMPAPGSALTILQQGRQITFPQAGLYRIDSTPARLEVREGEAQVADDSGAVVPVEHGMSLALDQPLKQPLHESSAIAANSARDAFDDWSRGREDSVSADNAIAANIQDPADLSDPAVAPDPVLVASGLAYPTQPGFTQFPMIGLSPVNSIYDSLYPFQPGFYSLYLPGYTYRPLFLLASPTAIRARSIYTPYSASRPGAYGAGLYGSGLPAARQPGISPITIRPRTTTAIGAPYSRPGPVYGARPAPAAAPVIVRPSAPVMRSAPTVAAPRAGGRR